MFTPRLPRPGSASLLLLGLVALLLWGQCGGRSGPDYAVRVVRVDSLRAPFAGAPPRLYLTLGLHNRERHDFTVESMRGVLVFRGLYWNDVNDPQRPAVVPSHTELLVPLVLCLTDSLACVPDSLRLLQRALRGGTARDSTLELEFGLDLNTGSNVSLHYLDRSYPLPAMRPRGRP
ncbi:hypothetical protein GO988_13455 [Hymenobacter sp. HMF4947]|uniref:Late embryogenesis abundant protein LEA-2 subgroup domain-containing protein n=1 Tax=Hymenobacter ginkgonis TaxID=2682976 RepID=A0A7K1TG10_9BACT|nr:hypothetical protein [Hymenobacter ginkgonis]MVN77336.1 hypothetical protein [Hymenobacter ginkgonis]